MKLKTYNCYQISLTGMTRYVYYLSGTEACAVSMPFLFGDQKVEIYASGKHWDCIVDDVTLIPGMIRKIESNDLPEAGFDILYGGFDRSELILKGYSSIEIRCEENRYCFYRQNVLLAESVPAGEDDTKTEHPALLQEKLDEDAVHWRTVFIHEEGLSTEEIVAVLSYPHVCF